MHGVGLMTIRLGGWHNASPHASISIVQHENAVRSIPGAFLEKNGNEGEKEKKAHAIEQMVRH